MTLNRRHRDVSRGSRSRVRLVCCVALALLILPLLLFESMGQTDDNGPWIAAVRIIRNGEQSGSGVYLKSGLILTAAHLTATEAEMSVNLAGVRRPASVLKQGTYEEIDLSLLSTEQDKLPKNPMLPETRLCHAPLGLEIQSSLSMRKVPQDHVLFRLRC